MPKVSMMGTMTCQDGKRDEMEAVLREMVDAARLEPGIEIYSYHRGAGNTFSFFALMSDEEAMQNHGQTDAMQAAMAAFGLLMAYDDLAQTITISDALGTPAVTRVPGRPSSRSPSASARDRWEVPPGRPPRTSRRRRGSA